MYARQISHLQASIKRLEEKSDNISWGRVIFFFVFVAGLGFENWFVIIGAVLGFAGFVYVHKRVDAFRHRLERRRKLAERQQGTASLDWNLIPAAPEVKATAALSPSLTELDILGERSLLRLIDWTFSSHGRDRLLALFSSNDVTTQEIARRNTLTNELGRLKMLRTRFLLLTEGSHQVDSAKMAELVDSSFEMPGAGVRYAATWLAQGAFAGLFVWSQLHPERAALHYSAAMVLIGVHVWARNKVLAGNAFRDSILISVSLDRFRTATRVLERFSSTSLPELRRVLEPFVGNHSATRTLSRLEWITGALSVRQNMLVHFLLHLVVPWDLIWTRQLEKIRLRLKEKLPAWQNAVAEFEAFASLAQFAEANPEYIVAKLLPAPALHATGLKHPLIPKARAVGNDISLTEKERCTLITGSNMSGKSTFLRTVGINLLLAKAGCPVAADTFAFADLPLYTSLGVSDSLDQGLSFFHAEVRRLSEILKRAKEGQGVFYLVDEIFRGTNNRERLQGSLAYIRELTRTSSLGLVTTHDLELASLETTSPSIVNYHFRESIENGTMNFSYLKARGPCPSTNALEIMRMNGLPVE